MKPFYVLIGTFFLSLIAFRLIVGEWELCWSGNIAMSVMLIFTSIGHFIFQKGMMMMLPNGLPYKKTIVFGTGVLEILAAIGLLLPDARSLTSSFLLVFFVCILPANISAALRKIDHEKATTQGKDVKYLWIRVPLQLIFMIWVWYFGY